MEKVIIPLVIILVIVGVIAGVVFYVKNKVRKFSQDLFGTDSLVEGWKKQEYIRQICFLICDILEPWEITVALCFILREKAVLWRLEI